MKQRLLRAVGIARPFAGRPEAATRKTVRWRATTPGGAPNAAAPARADDDSSWLLSSMDLVTGVDVLETGFGDPG